MCEMRHGVRDDPGSRRRSYFDAASVAANSSSVSSPGHFPNNASRSAASRAAESWPLYSEIRWAGPAPYGADTSGQWAPVRRWAQPSTLSTTAPAADCHAPPAPLEEPPGAARAAAHTPCSAPGRADPPTVPRGYRSSRPSDPKRRRRRWLEASPRSSDEPPQRGRPMLGASAPEAPPQRIARVQLMLQSAVPSQSSPVSTTPLPQ
jgi:hypothetical protein